jgi:hypothetical protein
MPDITVTPTMQTLTVSPTVQSLAIDALPAITINQTIPLTYAAGQLNTNTSVGSTQFVNLASVALSAGTWMVWGEIELYHTGAFSAYTQIADLTGATVIASAEGTLRASGFSLHMSISGVVSLGSATTLYIAAKSDTTITAKATTHVNSLAGCTNIKAIRLI